MHEQYLTEGKNFGTLLVPHIIHHMDLENRYCLH